MKRSQALLAFLIFSFVSSLLTLGCQVGLGPAVDTQPPVVSITTPVDDSVVGGKTVTIAGAYQDDHGIKTLNLRIYNVSDTSIFKQVDSVNGDVTITPSGPNGTWSYVLDTTSLPDGKYKAVASGFDGAFTSGEGIQVFEVDNTAPIMFLAKPNSIDFESPQSYGSIVQIAGEVGEDHYVSKMSVEIYRDENSLEPVSVTQYDESKNPYETNVLQYTNFELTSDTPVIIARYSEEIKNNLDSGNLDGCRDIEALNLHEAYMAMYGTAALGTTAKCFIYVTMTDNAGNESKYSYIRSLIRTATGIGNDFLVSTIKKILNGSTANIKDLDVEEMKTVLAQNRTGMYSENVKPADRKLYAVSVNSDIAPKYIVNSCLLDVTNWHTFGKDGSLAIQVSRKTSDNKEIIPSSIEVALYECDKDGLKFSGVDTIRIHGDMIYDDMAGKFVNNITTNVSDATYTVYLDGSGVRDNHYYLAEVTGEDEDGLQLSSPNTYGFWIMSSGNGPEITKVAMNVSDSAVGLVEDTKLIEMSAMDNKQVVGGVEKRYGVFEVEATDPSGETLSQVKVSIGDRDFLLTESSSGSGKYYSDVVDFSSFASNTYTINVNITGSGSNKTERAICISNDGPTIEIRSPSPTSTDILTEKVTVTGSCYSLTGSNVKDIKYLVVDNQYYKHRNSSDDVIINDILNYAGVTNGGSTFTWQFTFEPFRSVDVSKYTDILAASDETRRNSGVYDLPIWLYAEDDLGNYTLKKDYRILFDPYADRPKAEILYPSEDEVLSGAVRISGLASDNQSVNAVYLQLDANGDGKFTSADSTILKGLLDDQNQKIYNIETKADIGVSADFSADTSFWGFKASNTVSWSFVVNKYKELQRQQFDGCKKDGKYYIRVRAAALDNNDTLGLWTAPVEFIIDPAVPSIGSSVQPYVAQYSDEALTVQTAYRLYKDNMSLKGKWYLVTSVEQNTGISEVGYYEGKTLVEITSSSSAITAGFSKQSQDWSESGTHGYTVKIPLKTDAGTGTEVVRIFTTDIGGKYAAKDFYFKYDNDAPTQQTTSGSVLTDSNGKALAGRKLRISNNVMSIKGKYYDAGSDFERALVFFRRVREKEGLTTIELPLPRKESALNYSVNEGSAVVYAVSESTVSLSTSASSGSYTKSVTVDGKTKSYKTVCKDSSTGLYGVTLTGGSVSGATFTHALVPQFAFIRDGAVVNMAGSFRRIQSVSGTKVIFAEDLPSGATSGFFVASLVVDNQTEVSGWNGGINTISNDDGDGILESYSSETSTVTNWQASFYASELEDGVVFLDTMVFDTAENHTSMDSSVDEKLYSTKVMLTNHTPRVSKLYIASDLNCDSKFSDDELGYSVDAVTGEPTNYYYAATTSANVDSDFVTVTQGKNSTTTGVNMRDDLALAMELLGSGGYEGYASGTGSIKYRMDITSSAVTDVKKLKSSKAYTGSLSDFATSNRFSSATPITKNLGSLKKIYVPKDDLAVEHKYSYTEAATNYITVSLWDSSTGITQGDIDVERETLGGIKYYTSYGSQYTVLNIPLKISLVDITKPTASINPFYYNSITDNSIYGCEAAEDYTDLLGHIELEADLPAVFKTSGTGVWDRDPKVSGAVLLKGVAYDETRLEKINVAVDGIALNGSAKGAAVTMATYTVGSGWSYAAGPSSGVAGGTVEDDGWQFSLVDGGIRQDGHSVEWTLAIDTSRINLFAAVNVKATVVTVDSANNVSESSSYRMDVVPYITGIDSVLGRFNRNLARSALGKYSLSESETIGVKGFNFGDSAVFKHTAADGTVTTLAAVKSGSGVYEIDLSDYGDIGSGFLSVSVNGISSLNNENNNKSSSNTQPNSRTNMRLLDDVEIVVWEFQNIASRQNSNLTHAEVKVSPADGKIGAAFCNMYFINLPGIRAEDQQWYTQTPFACGYNGSVGSSFAFDKNGNTYAATEYQTVQQNAESGYFSLFFDRATKVGTSDSSGVFTSDCMGLNNSYQQPVGSIRLENTSTNIRQNYTYKMTSSVRNGYYSNDDWFFNLRRIVSPQIVAVSNADSSDVMVYVAYCDTSTNQIRFRRGSVNMKAYNEGISFASGNANVAAGIKDLMDTVYGVTDGKINNNSIRDIADYDSRFSMNKAMMTDYSHTTNPYLSSPNLVNPTDELKIAYSFPYTEPKHKVWKGTGRMPEAADSIANASGQTVHVVASSGISLGDIEVADIYKKSSSLHNYKYSAGESVSLGVTSNGTAVVAWHDAEANVLRFSYMTESDMTKAESDTRKQMTTSALEADNVVIPELMDAIDTWDWSNNPGAGKYIANNARAYEPGVSGIIPLTIKQSDYTKADPTSGTALTDYNTNIALYRTYADALNGYADEIDQFITILQEYTDALNGESATHNNALMTLLNKTDAYTQAFRNYSRTSPEVAAAGAEYAAAVTNYKNNYLTDYERMNEGPAKAQYDFVTNSTWMKSSSTLKTEYTKTQGTTGKGLKYFTANSNYRYASVYKVYSEEVLPAYNRARSLYLTATSLYSALGTERNKYKAKITLQNLANSYHELNEEYILPFRPYADLRYKNGSTYSVAATNCASRTTVWENHTRTVGTSGGSYVKVVVDSDDHIHIAYYNEGDLMYAYMDSVTSTPEVYMVDSYDDVGEYISLNVGKNSKGKQIPYIGFYGNKRAKYAMFNPDTATVASGKHYAAGVSNDYYTGAWEIFTVPTTAGVLSDNISVGVWTDSSGYLKAIPSGTRSSAANPHIFHPGDSTLIYANGSENPIVGYINNAGSLDMAQIR